LLLRRAYVADLIWTGLVAKAAGGGIVLIGARLGIPVSTVRGWLRVMAGRAEVVRHWFVAIAVVAGVDVSDTEATGSGAGMCWLRPVSAREAIAALSCGHLGVPPVGWTARSVAGSRVVRGRLLVTGVATGAGAGWCNTNCP